MRQAIEFIALFIAGLLGSSYGVVIGSGSLVKYPVLIFLGLPPDIAIGTLKISLFFEDISGTIAYQRKGLVKWRQAAPLALLGLPLALLGARTSIQIDTRYLNFIIAALLILLLFLIPRIKELTTKVSQVPPLTTKNLLLTVPIFTLLFFYEGFYGTSFITFMIFANIFFLRETFMHSVATARVVALVLTFGSGLVFLIGESTDLQAVLPLSLGTLVGSQLGVKATTSFSEKMLRRILQLIVGLTAGKLLYDTLSGFV